MTAREIVIALGGRWHGDYGMMQCPCHDDGARPGLKVRDDPRKPDGIDLHCFAGCDWRDVKAALRGWGLLPDRDDDLDHHADAARTARTCPAASPSRSLSISSSTSSTRCTAAPAEDQDRRQEHAIEIWRTSRPAEGSTVEVYLKSRGIVMPPPPSLRYHPRLKHGLTGLYFEAMVAAVQAPDRRIVAIHRTFLLPGGRGKAQVTAPKMALGRFGRGAVRLGAATTIMGIAEGIESALSAALLFRAPVWAALGARINQVALPPEVRHVVIFADNGEPGVRAAERAASAHMRLGRAVEITYPPFGFNDFNDELRNHGARGAA